MGSSWKGKRVGILGAGRSGLAAARLLVRLGARVLLSDESATLSVKPPAAVEVETGGHSARLLESDLLIRSPGVPDHLAVLRKARRKRIPIRSELELASALLHPRRLIAITGTNGKTTTTTLVGELFKAQGVPTIVAGNIGTPLSDVVARVHKNTVLVLEVSSYQLENIADFHPTVSAILNVTPDHLEHHGSLHAYAAAKARIFENQTARDVCVLNGDDPVCRSLAKSCKAQVMFFSRRKRLKEGVYFETVSIDSPPLKKGDLGGFAVAKSPHAPLFQRGESNEKGIVCIHWKNLHAQLPLNWRLPGPHNVENALAATAIAIAGGIPLSVIQRTLSRFKGVEHRLEFVRAWRGVRYINDSKATNVDSTRVALESFTEPLVLMMGGRGKGVPYTSLAALVKAHVRRLLLIGEDAKRIEQDLGKVAPFEQVSTLDRAVRRAADIARPGEVVLLSPACASFDQYHNYEERGRHFKRLVRTLKE